ncbi:hypothetical protein TNCV_4399671 [Trichonephila clavipes]|nr:hypothetical protein TNCV_4399671 [Trichonephila clavipes]
MACQVTRSFANRACLGRAGKATAAVPRYRRIKCADAKTMAGSSTGELNFENPLQRFCRLVGQATVHGRFTFVVVTETLPAKTVFEVPETMEIPWRKVGAVWCMVQNLPAKRFD